MQSNSFVANIDPKLADRMVKDLADQGFTIAAAPHTFFTAKKSGVSCTFYTSGKLVVQGKDKQGFIEFYLEPHILKSTPFTYGDLDLDLRPRIGIDESGKGDFFGPLCIAGVQASGDEIKRLKEIGVKDSKTLNDAQIHTIAKKIKAEFHHHIVRINPAKYNELYDKFKNLNHLLAWGHATTIEALMEETKCADVIIDQFAAEYVVLTALKRKKLSPTLTQRHKGEEDPVVAAASILARDAFVEGLEKLSSVGGITLPKGASQAVIKAGKKIYQELGMEGLTKTAKLHFKTLDQIRG